MMGDSKRVVGKEDSRGHLLKERKIFINIAYYNITGPFVPVFLGRTKTKNETKERKSIFEKFLFIM